jgi:O-antigen/teichoic acid export membrane protein
MRARAMVMSWTSLGLRVPGLVRRFGLLLVSQGAAAAGQFGAAVIVARALGPADFGVWAYAVAYASIFASVVDFGMSFVVVRDLARPQHESRSYLGNVLAIKGVLSVCALALGAALLPLLGGGMDRWPVLALLGGQAVLASFAALIAAAVYVRGHLLASVAIRVFQGALLFGGVGTVALVGSGLLRFASVYIAIGAVGAAVALAIAVATIGRFAPRVDREFWRPYLGELLPIALAVMLTTVYYSADTLMLGLAGQERETGWYNAAYRVIFGLLLLLGALNQTFLPDTARSLDADGTRSPETLVRYYRAIWAFAMPIAALGPLAAPALMTLLYGSDYGGGARAMQILFVAGGLAFVSSYFSSAMLVAGRQRQYLGGVALAAGCNVALNAALIPVWSLDGAALSTVISEGLVVFWMRWRAGDVLPDEARGVPVAPAAAGCAVAAVAGLAVALGAPALPAVVAAGLGYAGALYLSTKSIAGLWGTAEALDRRAA